MCRACKFKKKKSDYNRNSHFLINMHNLLWKCSGKDSTNVRPITAGEQDPSMFTFLFPPSWKCVYEMLNDLTCPISL